MNKVSLLLASVLLAACQGEGNEAAPGVVDAQPAPPTTATPPPDPNAPCVEEIFQGQFCLGGTLERFQEKRNVPLTSKFSEKGFDLARYSRVLPLGVEEQILITMENGIIVGAERTWQGMSEAIEAIDRQASSPWYQMLGAPEHYTEAGYSWTRLKGKGYTVEMGADPRVETRFGYSSFMIRITLSR